MVMDNSIALMKAYGFCRKGATDEEALDAFDDIVRTTVPQAIVASTGRVGCPYSLILPMCLVLLGLLVDGESGQVASNTAKRPMREACLNVIPGLANSFGSFPLTLAAMFGLLRRRLDLHGCREVLYCMCVSVTGAGMYIVSDAYFGLMSFVVAAARESDVLFGATILWNVAVLAATALVYRPATRVRVCRPFSEPSPSYSAGGVVEAKPPSAHPRVAGGGEEVPQDGPQKAPCAQPRLANGEPPSHRIGLAPLGQPSEQVPGKEAFFQQPEFAEPEGRERADEVP